MTHPTRCALAEDLAATGLLRNDTSVWAQSQRVLLISPESMPVRSDDCSYLCDDMTTGALVRPAQQPVFRRLRCRLYSAAAPPMRCLLPSLPSLRCTALLSILPGFPWRSLVLRTFSPVKLVYSSSGDSLFLIRRH
ncbi:hypothetical protein MSAN_01103900 [Mycena sanguinolenta]|uniref:Uncharacterized protein n=1 Tax=Mycena sanguinolenta TaxID=230812 RepID=A0A8H6YTM6_9AGAR|nr:hypothetical protein MSAN_01103900 [Mycena sanguinolenta]